MTKKAESRLQRRIRERLETVYKGSFWVKFHGGPFTRAGVPDLLGCVDGRFFAFEVKCDDGEPTEIQKRTIKKLQFAGAVSLVVRTPQEAVRAVRQALRLPAASS